MTILRYGDSAARKVSERVCEPCATMTVLKAIPGDRLATGTRALVLADGSAWRWNAASVLTSDDVLVSAPTAGGTGRWLRECGGATLTLPITFATADATALLTMQAGSAMHILEAWWEMTADWTGGTASTIGVSSSKTSFTTKGDLLGGATGSLAAALTAAGSPNFGTVGTGFDTLAKRRALWVATNTIRHDRITSAFTAGSGSLKLSVNIVANAGA